LAYDSVGSGRHDGEHQKVDFVLVDVDAEIIGHNSGDRSAGFASRFSGRTSRPADVRVGVGDNVQVTIFEAKSGGLFIPGTVTLPHGNFVRIPEQEVDKLGIIKVPYAGNIKVIGRHPADIQDEIEKKLTKRAIEPQAVVSIIDRNSNAVTVLGDVKEAGRFNVAPNGYSILDAIGAAKGSNFQDFETEITLLRAQRRASIRMSMLTRYPKSNIYLQPDDTIFVRRKQRKASIFGAVEKNGEFLFDRDRMTLADGLARGGGLVDERADPGAVVIYRLEDRELLQAYRADIPGQYGKLVPTVYRINVRNADGFFHAQNFELKNDDLIYVANASWVDKVKISSIISGYTGAIAARFGSI
jgi:polysaccharide export outer membrane protein